MGSVVDTEKEVKEKADDDEEEEEEEEERGEVKKKEGSLYILLRCSLLIFLSLLVTFSLPIFGLIVEFLIGSSSFWNPISVHSQCKILSSSVDLRSSKVCELGLLNYKAKHVFYPSDTKKFRCHYDYYWASVFEVEYMDHSGQQRLAFAEAPNEALPPTCRPNFGGAWLTKDKFKVNETYGCWYTVGVSKVYVNSDALFKCHSTDPSIIEMLTRRICLSMRLVKSYIFTGGPLRHWRWDVVAGVVVGFSTSLLSFGMGRLMNQLKSILHQTATLSHRAAYLKRICFFVAYFSCMSWLALHYIKGFGLLDILHVDNSW